MPKSISRLTLSMMMCQNERTAMVYDVVDMTCHSEGSRGRAIMIKAAKVT
jgi:hypothetical protein